MTSSSSGTSSQPDHARLAEPLERDHAAEQEDERELAELLEQLGAVVHAAVDLVVALVAAEAQAAGERGEEAVRAGDLGHAVEQQHGGERDPAVEVVREELAVAQPHGQRGEQVAAERRRCASPPRSPYSDVGERPAARASPSPSRRSTNSPRKTNGNARPSFSPASAVTAKRGSRSSSSPGGPMPRSPASTGSVGASIAPSRIAAPTLSPIAVVPHSATAAIVSGIAMPSSRHTVVHSRERSDRSTFMPAREQRDDDRDLGEVLDDRGLLDRVDPAEAGRR